MMSKLIEEQYNESIERMKNIMIEYDDSWFKKRDKSKYKVVRYRSRNIVTEFGNIKIKRRIYSYIDENGQKTQIIPLDIEFEFGKRNKIHPSLKGKILQEAGSGKRYRDIVDQFPKANLTKMTISRIFKDKKLLENMQRINSKVELKDNQNLYINMDDTFPKAYDQEAKKIRVQKFRVISFNTGYKIQRFRSKKELANKRIFFIEDPDAVSGIQVAKEIQKWGNKFYSNFNNANIIIGGDGATWIKGAADELNGHYVLDNFHAQKYLLDTFDINKRNPKLNKQNYNLYNICYTYFLNGKYEELMTVLKEFADEKTITYFRLNVMGVKAWAKKWNIGVSAESDMSLLVKSLLGYGAKRFNADTLMNLVATRAYKINNFQTF